MSLIEVVKFVGCFIVQETMYDSTKLELQTLEINCAQAYGLVVFRSLL